MPIDDWIRDMTNIGSNVYHANIIGQGRARGVQYQNVWHFTCKEAVSKILPLKTPGT